MVFVTLILIALVTDSVFWRIAALVVPQVGLLGVGAWGLVVIARKA
jgi:hypothetical protein